MRFSTTTIVALLAASVIARPVASDQPAAISPQDPLEGRLNLPAATRVYTGDADESSDTDMSDSSGSRRLGYPGLNPEAPTGEAHSKFLDMPLPWPASENAQRAHRTHYHLGTSFTDPPPEDDDHTEGELTKPSSPNLKDIHDNTSGIWLRKKEYDRLFKDDAERTSDLATSNSAGKTTKKPASMPGEGRKGGKKRRRLEESQGPSQTPIRQVPPAKLPTPPGAKKSFLDLHQSFLDMSGDSGGVDDMPPKSDLGGGSQVSSQTRVPSILKGKRPIPRAKVPAPTGELPAPPIGDQGSSKSRPSFTKMNSDSDDDGGFDNVLPKSGSGIEGQPRRGRERPPGNNWVR